MSDEDADPASPLAIADREFVGTWLHDTSVYGGVPFLLSLIAGHFGYTGLSLGLLGVSVTIAWGLLNGHSVEMATVDVSVDPTSSIFGQQP